jgi:methylenetetrahydrofolate reductase (NADPH)
LHTLLNEGRFVVTAELGPPKSPSSKSLRRAAASLAGHVDAINVTDNQTAVVRLCSLAGCLHVMAEGVEPVLHMTCRDRNRIGLQSDLLGAYSLGIRNVLALTGDHPSMGNHPDARAVFDLDSIALCGVMRKMRDSGCFSNGEPCKPAPKFSIGVGENPFAGALESSALRLAQKAAAGADFVQTQPVYDLERFTEWMSLLARMGLDQRLPVIAGVLPVRSLALLERIARVPGLSVPGDAFCRFTGLTTDEQQAEGIRMAAEIVAAVRKIPGVQGVHIMAINWPEAVPEIIGRAGLLPRPAASVADSDS